MIDHKEIERSHCSATKPFGDKAILKCLGKQIQRGMSPTHWYVQNAMWKPFPSLNVANESTFLRLLEMEIQGLLKLFPNFSFVCQSKASCPWMLLTICLHNELSSFEKCQPHFARRAKFLFLRLPTSRLPYLWERVTLSHFTKSFSLLPACPSQRNFLMILSIERYRFVRHCKNWHIISGKINEHLITYKE